MKILYAIQGTGNGHVCRAEDIVPILQKKGDVDVLISGTQADIALPFPVKYKFDGLSFIFGKKGGVDLFETYKKSRLKRLFKEIKSLPIQEYDLVISDFEPVSSWACYMKNKPCIALSHQAAVIDKRSPRPKKIDPVGKTVLKGYAPASARYGFHFKQYSENIFTPVIRKTVRETPSGNKGHYTVYLPAYNDRRIIKILSQFKDIKWEVFSKHSKEAISIKNVEVFPINNEEFIQSMASSAGVLSGAGFETPAEALYLNKKLLVIPMKNQFEQHCNAAALKEMGVPVMKSLKEKHLHILEEWLMSDNKPTVNYPDNTEKIIDNILADHGITKG
ncbi:MAG: glycosyl transferase [Chitinophagaceae bacterium]|nr:glycosyl transferase [Chitinophagaceae bacterium]